jgi:hypothetical protein
MNTRAAVWTTSETEGSGIRSTMSTWIQQHTAGLDLFSSALFCLWLSTVSLLPLFFTGMM